MMQFCSILACLCQKGEEEEEGWSGLLWFFSFESGMFWVCSDKSFDVEIWNFVGQSMFQENSFLLVTAKSAKLDDARVIAVEEEMSGIVTELWIEIQQLSPKPKSILSSSLLFKARPPRGICATKGNLHSKKKETFHAKSATSDDARVIAVEEEMSSIVTEQWIEIQQLSSKPKSILSSSLLFKARPPRGICATKGNLHSKKKETFHAKVDRKSTTQGNYHQPKEIEGDRGFGGAGGK
ncbi:hypothetical protein Droror1_Dr00027463 [Drosera rotundifolia]